MTMKAETAPVNSPLRATPPKHLLEALTPRLESRYFHRLVELARVVVSSLVEN